MWSWRRIATVAVLLGGGIACTLVPGAQPFAGPLIAGAIGLALGISTPPLNGNGNGRTKTNPPGGGK